MSKDNFLQLLKDTAREQSFLGQEKFVPDFLSDFSNYVATHLWQAILILSIISVLILNFYQTMN